MRGLLTILSVLVMLAVGLGYLLVEVARFDPFAHPMRVTVDLARSGGLLGRSEVTYRGYPVGHITDIGLRPGGVRVTAEIDEGVEIPVDTDVAVADLSAAGEQYLDFRPRTDAGPFLADGAVVDERDTRTPIPFAQLVGNISGLTQQLEPEQLTVVVDEMARAFGGSAPELTRILDGGDFLLAGLEGVLPETVRTLQNGRVVLGTVSDLRGELARFGVAGQGLTGTLRGADPTLRELLDGSPETLALIDDVVRTGGPSVAALLGDLATVSEVVAARLPAIGEFLPELSEVGPSAAMVIRDGKVFVLVDLAPRPSCIYDTPRRSPTIGGSPPPRLDRYCTDTGPRLQQRGSENVPR